MRFRILRIVWSVAVVLVYFCLLPTEGVGHPPLMTGPHYWLLGLPAIALAAAPWIRWRFTLRTLLIAITFIAVVLGMFVYIHAARESFSSPTNHGSN
jgi:hypothetical protein